MKRSILLEFLLLLAFDTAGQVGIKFGRARRRRRDVASPRGPRAADLCGLLRAGVCGAAHGHIVTVPIICMLFLGEHLTVAQSLAGLAILAFTETGDAAPPPERER